MAGVPQIIIDGWDLRELNKVNDEDLAWALKKIKEVGKDENTKC